MTDPAKLARVRRRGPVPWKRIALVTAVLVAVTTPIFALYLERVWKSETAAREPLRDIYYLIFDRYANEGVLADVYDYDNRRFLDALERRGFYIASESNANYPMTAFSLLSSMNMEYLDIGALEAQATDGGDWTPVYERLAGDSVVEDFVHDRGYSYVHIGSWWGPTASSSEADLVVRWDAQKEFLALLEESTGAIALPRTGIDPPLEGFNARHREHALFQFDVLPEISATGGPNFVVCHFLLPHDPYVFGPDGGWVDNAAQLRRGRTTAYVEQLQYTNRRILQLVDSLLERSEIPPIILIQADEGPYPARFARGGELNAKFSLIDATPAEIREKFGILNALYLPGVDPAEVGLHPASTPVNSFRVVLNAYFGTDFAMLPAHHYSLRDREHIYDISEVTEHLE